MQKHWALPDLPKNANVKSFPLFEEFELFLHRGKHLTLRSSSSWECHGPSSGQLTEQLGGRRNWFLAPKVIQQSWHKVFRKIPHTQRNGWAPYRPDRKTTKRPGHLHYSCSSISSMTAVWVYIFPHTKTAFDEKLSIWRLAQCPESFLEHIFGPQILDVRIVIPVEYKPFIEKLCLIQTLLAMEVQEYLRKWLLKHSVSRWEEKPSCSLKN